ncbi:MAG: asparagine synthase (glutamine-hydrolyzing) [Patescibacteria group bacterium]
MCGVIGISEGRQEILLRGGLKVIEHRGPDDMGVFADDFVTLGHQRLAIIDLSPLGHQPMQVLHNGKTISISFNGEVYNYKELKKDLIEKGCVFVGGSDTEVILRGFILEGKNFLEKLRGMWALAIYDAEKKEVILSRDHFGIKPLYYIVKDNKIYFASEIKALKKIVGIRFTPNSEAYYEFYNLGYFLGENTCYKEIKKILPGEVLVWNIKNCSFEKSFLSLIKESEKEINFDKAVEMVNETILESVEKHYIADVPVGLLLSGGADSSLIAALSKKIGKKPICYHVAIPGSIDTRYAIEIAKYLGFELVSKELSPGSLKDEYENMEDWLDQPSSDVSLLPTNLVYKSISKESKVVLSGEGGDELFGGYLRHQKLAGLNKVGGAGSILNPLYSSSTFGLNFVNPVVRRIQERLATSVIDMYLHNVKTIGLPIEDKKLKKKLLDFYNNHPYKNLIPNNLFFDQFAYLPDSLMYKNDITSMASSIEARVPLVDKEVLLAVGQIPNRFRLSPEYLNKRILKTILKKYLPEDLVERPKKGFGFSFDKFGAEFFIADYKKATRFHLENAKEFGLDTVLIQTLNNTSPAIICQKFPRFAFSLITNHRVMSKS